MHLVLTEHFSSVLPFFFLYHMKGIIIKPHKSLMAREKILRPRTQLDVRHTVKDYPKKSSQTHTIVKIPPY